MLFAYLTGLSLIALIYPYAIYPLVLRLLKRRDFRPASAAALNADARVALLFCAYNEEASLPAKIANLRAMKAAYPSLGVHAYTDGCTDNSVAILRAASDVLTVHEGPLRVGKATGMRKLVESTDADILVFTDANVTIDPQAIPRLLAYFSVQLIGSVAGTLHYTNPNESNTARTGSAYWRLEETIKKLESDTGSTMGADGSLFAIRRSLYPVVPPNLLDDMISSINPMFHGYRVVSAPDVHAFEKATTDSMDEIRRKRRISCRAFKTHRYLKPQLRKLSTLNKFKYYSHKYLRWISALFLTLTVIFGVLAIVDYFGMGPAMIAVAGAGGLAYISRIANVPLIGGLTEMTLSILATGVGVLEAIAGREYQTWAPARGRST